MKRLSLFVAALLLSLTGFAQGIVFETGSWSDVLAKSKETGKPIFVDVYTTWCGPCKMMSRDIFPMESVGKVYNANFVCYKLDAEAGEGVEFAKKYEVKGYPTYLYLRADGTVIYRFMGSCQAETFLKVTETALKEFQDPKTLEVWNSEYTTHQNDSEFLKAYIMKRSKLGIPAVDLLEAYIKLLPESDYDRANLPELFVTQQDNFRIGTFAFEFMLQHPNIFTGRYASFLSYVLESVIMKSVRIAAFNKDQSQLENAVELCKKISVEGFTLTSDDIYMTYYRATNEQDKYLTYVFKKSDQIMDMVFKDSVQLKLKPKLANDLNENAWQMYLIYSKAETLKHALLWSKRAVEWAPGNYTYMDTQACLLYKLGKKREAIKLEKKALSLIEKSSSAYSQYETVVKRMKAGEKIWEK